MNLIGLDLTGDLDFGGAGRPHPIPVVFILYINITREFILLLLLLVLILVTILGHWSGLVGCRQESAWCQLGRR